MIPVLLAGTTIVISDTHMGVGKDGDDWHAYEDFRWADEFDEFLDHVGRYPEPVRLVFAGDAFELWQSVRDGECVGKRPDEGCSEKEATRRTKRILNEHRPTMEAMADWVAEGDRAIVFVPGNHDAALLFPGVRRTVLGAFRDAPDGRVDVDLRGHWISPDGRVRVEHGHQIGADANHFRDWPRPFTDSGRIWRPWGEKFVQDWFNALELRFPVIDNLASMATAARLARQAAGEAVLPTATRFFRELLIEPSFAQKWANLGHTGTPGDWDFAAIRAQGDAWLLDSFAPDDPLREALAAQVGGEGLTMADFDDDLLALVCEGRAARHEAEPGVVPCPVVPQDAATLGRPIVTGLLRHRAAVQGRHIAKSREEAESAQVDVLVWGHTHLAEKPVRVPVGDGEAWVVNSGTWTRLGTDPFVAGWQEERSLDAAQVFPQLDLHALPPCYSFVVVPDGKAPQLRFWASEDGKHWENRDDCPTDRRF